MVIAVFWPDLNYAAVADVKCNVANAPAIVGAYAALAHAPVPAIRNTPIAELSSQFQLQKIMPYKLGLSISRESALLRTQLPSKQVDDILAANQANQILVKPIKVSTDELSRAKKSQECRTALSNLNKSFERNRVDMGFDPDSAFGLNDFSTWYFTTTRSPQQQAAAALVVKAQQAYDQACLSNAVPVDVGPDLIRRAVGMFSFNEIPFCTGLRTKGTEVLTARHCFLNNDGTASKFLTLARLQRGNIWFSYEAEPDKRFEVCTKNVADGEPLSISSDQLTVTIAPTIAPLSPVSLRSQPIPEGTSLYVRGYFAFGTESEILERMRATAYGGCIVLFQKNGCTFHSCQALSGMSGAPVFSRAGHSFPPTSLEVVGIHIGAAGLATESPSNCDFNGTKLSEGNVAAMPKGIIQ